MLDLLFQIPLKMQKTETVRFLKSTEETNGEYILIECNAVPGATTPVHYHKIITQIFEVMKGNLTIKVGEKENILERGDILTVPPETPHIVYNNSSKTALFKCTLKPGHKGHEDFLRMAYANSPVIISEENKLKIYLNADTYMP